MTERTEYEPTPELETADYEAYRRVVDAFSPAFRKVGIVDPTGYDQALRDPNTVRMRIGSVELPLIVPLSCVSGYDVPRTQRLTGQDDAYLLATPLSVLADPEARVLNVESEFKVDTSTIVVETDHADAAEIKEILPGVLSESVGAYEVGEFRDERIRNPEQQPAMMAMYEAKFEAVNEAGEAIPYQGKNFFTAYNELVESGHPATADTKLLHVDELRENEQLVEDLWDLCSNRFDWLGEAHPVSMEDTKDFFVQMILNDDTHTIVRYNDEGRPVCLGFFMSNLDECSWLKSEFSDKLTADTHAKGEQTVYFYGIAGKSEQAAAHYGRDVMQLLSHTVHQIGGTHRLFFESTNMSSRYIPRMVGQYVGQGAGLQMTESPARIAQQDYWYLKPVKND